MIPKEKKLKLIGLYMYICDVYKSTLRFTGICFSTCKVEKDVEIVQEEIAPGVIKLTKGEVDTYTPYAVLGGKPVSEAMHELPEGKLPFSLDDVCLKVCDRGCVVEIPLDKDEQLYGFGLQYGTFGQRGLRKRPIVNDNPLNDLGYTHAPQPFYVSTKGYGILVNTARYTIFLCGSNQQISQNVRPTEGNRNKIAVNTEELYENRSGGNKVFIDIPGAKGIEDFRYCKTYSERCCKTL